MNTKKNCAELWQFFGCKEADTHCKVCDRSCARGGFTLEREFGLTDFILETVSRWPRE